MKPLCIYHGNCADGFGAAWALWKRFGDGLDFYPGVYQKPPPDVRGRDVYLVDFCYKREVMLEMAKQARFLLVLDHHKTAMEDLYQSDKDRVWRCPYPKEVNWNMFVDDLFDAEPGDIYTVFDMERSGAGITWDFFHPNQKRPALINHIEDRDLWRFALPKTREIQAAIFSRPYDFQIWDDVIAYVEMYGTAHLVTEGTAIERKHHKDIEELIQVVTRPMRFRTAEYHNSVIVPVANLPYTFTSDAGHLLCERSLAGRPSADGKPYKHPFAACYWDKPSGRQFSLRSRDDGADVGEIAKLYGGGGHAHAAGFEVPYDRLREFEP